MAANLQVNPYTKPTLIAPDGIHPIDGGQIDREYARQIIGKLKTL